MNKKEQLKYEIESLKNQIKQHSSSLKSNQEKLSRLEEEYNRVGPRMFLIRELDDSDFGGIIAGRRERFVITEVYTEPNPMSLGPKDIFVKQAM